MAVNSKQKGNAWEREVANFLAARFEAFLGVPKGFIRKPDSGSYFGGKNVARKETHLLEMQSFGDIITPETFNWTIEAKHYKTPFSLNALLDENCPDLDKWSAQAEQDASSAGKMPLMVIKFNNVRPFVMVRREDLEEWPEPPVNLRGARFGYKGWLAFPMDQFFSNADTVYFTT